jgi:uncharacterized SAM-binding protein YcdF (DUF218 family)
LNFLKRSFFHKTDRMPGRARRFSLFKNPPLTILLVLVVGWPLFSMGQILIYSRFRDNKPANAAIILGAAVYRGRPSPVFQERINHAVALYQSGQVQALIFTGGIGYGDQLAEGQVGKRTAQALGVPPEAVFMETVSTSTQMNLQEAAKIVTAQKWERVLIVSDPYHMFRSVQIATDLGMDAHPSPTPSSRYRSFRTRLRFLIQETISYFIYSVEHFFSDQHMN